MKKTLLIGLLISAIMVLSLTGCKNNVELDTGTSPKVLHAFFASSNGNGSDTFDSVEKKYKITKLNLHSTTDVLMFKIEDPEADLTEIQISPHNTFDIFYHWTDLNFSSTDKTITNCVRCGWNLDSSEKAKYIQENKPIYVRAIDKKGNISKTFTIENITISSGTAPVINEIFCTNKNPEIDPNTGTQEWPRLSTVSNSEHFAVVVDFLDPDFDVTELHISFDDFKTYDIFQITSQDYEHQISWWHEIYYDFTGTYTVKAYLIDKGGNKSQTITKSITFTN